MVCIESTFMVRLLFVCLFCPRWNSSSHSSRHRMLFITFMQPFVSFCSLNCFPFVLLITLFLVSNNHLPQSLINVAKGENHNLLISCKEGRKYHWLKCSCWVRPLWHTCAHTHARQNKPRMAWNAFFGHFGCQWKPLKRRSLTMLILKCSSLSLSNSPSLTLPLCIRSLSFSIICVLCLCRGRRVWVLPT